MENRTLESVKITVQHHNDQPVKKGVLHNNAQPDDALPLQSKNKPSLILGFDIQSLGEILITLDHVLHTYQHLACKDCCMGAGRILKSTTIFVGDPP